MANEENLVSLAERATSVRREIASKGGKARAAKVRKEKTFKEIFKALLDVPMDELEGKCPRDAIAIAMIIKAANGDKPSAEFVRDTVGEKPAEKLDVNASVNSLDKEQRDAAVQAALLGLTE